MPKYILVILMAFAAPFGSRAQSYYYPPLTGSGWDTVSPASLGWCVDSIPPLLEMLDETNSKAFIVLKDGKIALEAYFDDFPQDSIWYWASAGKSLTAFLTGLAQEQGYLDVTEPTSTYLGQGWTTAPLPKEGAISVWHQLTMTTGLDDNVANVDCTLDTCLVYLADAGTRWAYHNAPYTLLDPVLENATGKNLNVFFYQQLQTKTGMTGAYIQRNYNNVFFSTPRSMARFGLLALSKGKWNLQPVMTDTAYFNAMVNTSQSLNQAYGYLWWLNGKASFMLPQSSLVFNGPLAPSAPMDMLAAMGRDGQILSVVPTMDLVVVRMGESPGNSFLVPTQYADSIWQKLMPVLNCSATGIKNNERAMAVQVYPNPSTGIFRFVFADGLEKELQVINMLGETIISKTLPEQITEIDLSGFPSGYYFYRVITENGTVSGRLVVQ